ncbi:MlaE family ABC transporter permease [Amycolatopsis echigonensis]|uniref:MlaE family ABC transporter permease n=1 Tax=Amycolatopsis echigonensis TaxID=2576905 RepID=UPI0028A70D94|nr:ABC transporter permease [Amycolatopsis echigonensis]
MSSPSSAVPVTGTKRWPRARRAADLVAAPLADAGEIVRFGGQVIWSAVRHPVGYWGEVRAQVFDALRLCWFPLIISSTAFGLGVVGIQAGNLLALLGVPERLGSLMVVGSVREFGPWIDAMIVAGVVGTAMTADLGARRTREEIDAMEVLGVDPIRTLIVPRVVAMVIVTALMDMVSLACGVVGGYIGAVPFHGADATSFFSLFFANSTTTDIWATVAKTALFGLIIGIVCSFKGYRAAGGPVGVGRAVNQGVVIAFASTWIFNAVFTAILLGLNPDMQAFK